MKNNKGLIIFVIVLLIICVLLLSGILFVSLNSKTTGIRGLFKTSNVSNQRIVDKTYDHAFESIDIDVDAADIEIKEGQENKVVIYGDEERLTINDNNTLSIKYKSEPCNFLCFNGIDATKIEIYLPNDYEGDIKITNDFGDINIADFRNSNIKIESSYGDTSVDAGKNVDISSDCGDIKLGEVENAILENNYGNIKVNKITNKAEIKDDCGDIKIKEVDLKENSTIENNFGDIEINKTNDILIESKVSLGNNKVNNNNYKSDITLQITNDCGDIKVN